MIGANYCNSKYSNQKIHSLIIFNISEKSIRTPHTKRRILEGFCVCFISCIWKTSVVKSNHLFFIFEKKGLTLDILGKRGPDTLKKNY